MSSGEKKPKVRKKTPPHALTKPHKNKKKYNRKEKRKNLDEVIKKRKKPQYYDRTLKGVSAFWKERWATNRAKNEEFINSFDPKKFINQQKKFINCIIQE